MDAKDVIRIAESISLSFANRSDESTLIEFAEAIAAAEREAGTSARLEHEGKTMTFDEWEETQGFPSGFEGVGRARMRQVWNAAIMAGRKGG